MTAQTSCATCSENLKIGQCGINAELQITHLTFSHRQVSSEGCLFGYSIP